MTAPRHRLSGVTLQDAVTALLLAGVLLYCAGGLWGLAAPKTQTVLAGECTVEAFARENGVTLYGQPVVSGLTVPRGALHRDSGGAAVVYIAQGGQARRHEVTVLAETDAAVLISAPTLKKGAAVIMGEKEIYEGMPIS